MGKGWDAVKAASPRESDTKSDHPPAKASRLWLAALGGARAEVVPASNRVSLKVAEQERQVRLARSNLIHKYMLLPDSTIRYCWDLLLAVVTILLIWRVPYTIAFGDSDLWYWYAFNKSTDAIYLLDVVLNFRKYMKFAYAFQVFACYISVIHGVACLWAGPMIGLTDVEDEQLAYNQALYSSVLLLLNISGVAVEPEWQFVSALLGVVGFLFQCLTLASVTAGVIGSSSRALQYQEKVRMVMSDLKALHVPSELRKAAKNYYETLWRMKNTSERYEKAIYEDEDLSPALRSEIALYIHRNLIATVPLFQDCSDSCLAACVMRLKTQLYMRGDVVFHKGDSANSMVIISRGKVKVISPDNEGLLAVLKQGSFFGEIGLLRHMTRSCTVIAGTFCELKSLDRNDAEEIFDAYPHIHDRLFAEAEKRRLDTRLKARLYNVKVLDNAHAVDVSSIVEIPNHGGNANLQPFVHGQSDDKTAAPPASSSSSGSKTHKLVRANSFQTEEASVVNSELDSMGLNLEEIKRLVEVLKDTQTRLARVQDRRMPLHQVLNTPTPTITINPALIGAASSSEDHSSTRRRELHHSGNTEASR
ncbi:hypothetical protein BBJ28_00022269 [Nothophytophthora sp. Chile5]|nr:hypothetical protein BBJ28_00022269 [Nothophytophthora sp. Chile5]